MYLLLNDMHNRTPDIPLTAKIGMILKVYALIVQFLSIVAKRSTLNMQAVDFLLLSVLLQLLLAQHSPHEVYSRQRHEGHEDLCNSDGAGSCGLRHLWHDNGWQRPGGQDTAYCRTLHGMLYNVSQMAWCRQ